MQTDIPPTLNLSVGKSPKAAAHSSSPPIVCTPSPVTEETDSDSSSGSSQSCSNSFSTLPLQSRIVEEILDSPPSKRKRYTVVTCWHKAHSRGKAALDKLALAQINREIEKKLVQQTKDYMQRKGAEVNMQPKKEISDEKLRPLCLQSQHNLKSISIQLQRCDVAKEQNKLAGNEANKTDFNMSQNDAKQI